MDRKAISTGYWFLGADWPLLLLPFGFAAGVPLGGRVPLFVGLPCPLDPPVPVLAGAAAGGCLICFTFTCTPSSSESAGLITIQSVGFNPCKTSSVVP